MATTIPVIDFQHYGLQVENTQTVTDEDLKQLGEEIHEAFRTIGFCYIKNHGIPQEMIDKAFKISKDFFDLPVDTKTKVKRSVDSNNGWVSPGRESLNPDRPGDLKEAFNFKPPDEKDREFIRQCHQNIGNGNKNQTTLRSLMYPPLPTDGSILPGQTRCGEHCDYGTVTMLFQDDIGGLEVCNTTGKYIQATPVPGAICVNIGDLMQRWTADELKATKHRVLIPEDEVKKNKGRQSMAFFIHPDDDCVIKCLDGSDKYQPITALDYLNWRFSLTYY
ncbi:hypothetical protein SNE40_020522 [Patella caerulea]|uniref:Fe2OG dioxygenase domain-containing protein n=1 Tax=Patella caerulea TaxID=87958 RepID=A0AAN8J1A6_PATCE